jgi:hypothetical protein
MLAYPRIRVLVVCLCALVLATPAAAAEPNPRVLPPQSHPHGMTYGEWAAAWWQWALEIPTSVNPLLDPTGEHCAEGQSGKVWFLAGVFGSGSVTRTCTVPTGTALFFPLLNAGWFALLSDPEEQRTEEFVRAQVDCEPPSELTVTIDGVPVRNPLRYFEMSPLFDVQLPEDNIFGLGPDVIPELRLSPSVDQGYYLFLAPLPPGEHVIQWSGAWVCPFGPSSQDVTYVLTVLPRGRK